jgi:hypothetical protein
MSAGLGQSMTAELGKKSDVRVKMTKVNDAVLLWLRTVADDNILQPERMN